MLECSPALPDDAGAMRSLGDLLHKTPWWALLLGGFALIAALAVFVTPFQLIRLERSGASPQENRAIKREIDSTLSEGAIDMARGIVKELHDHTRDPARRAELGRALDEIAQAREGLRVARRDAAQAVKDARKDVVEAKRDLARAKAELRREAAKAREADAKGVEAAPPQQAEDPVAEAKAPEADGETRPRTKRIIVMGANSGKPMIDLQLDAPGAGPPPPPLPPELRAQIRQKVTGDLWRIGLGTALILLFIPLFILTVISKIFIDRSRGAQQLAELKRKEADYHRMGRQVTEAKLAALQAQVEPHFLYNTLASVQALTEVDPAQANAMTGHLIQYLRNALPKMRGSGSTIGQEIELVRAYLAILKMRMGERLAFTIDLPPELADVPFPPLMLPSLVENAIKHGLEPQREGGEVAITVAAVDGKVRVTVADTGRGFAATPGAGVGLANIRERLAALYGEAARLTLEAREPHGVVATLEVPREGPRAEAAAAMAGDAPVPPAAPRPAGRAARTLAAMGSAERVWRKGLSFTFMVLVGVAGVLAGLAVLGVASGMIPVHIGGAVGGTAGALIGTAGIAIAFAAIVLGLGIVLAVVYGLGFLFVGLAVFIPIAILVGLFPVLAPFILAGLGIWWLVRRRRRNAAAAQPRA